MQEQYEYEEAVLAQINNWGWKLGVYMSSTNKTNVNSAMLQVFCRMMINAGWKQYQPMFEQLSAEAPEARLTVCKNLQQMYTITVKSFFVQLQEVQPSLSAADLDAWAEETLSLTMLMEVVRNLEAELPKQEAKPTFTVVK